MPSQVLPCPLCGAPVHVAVGPGAPASTNCSTCGTAVYSASVPGRPDMPLEDPRPQARRPASGGGRSPRSGSSGRRPARVSSQRLRQASAGDARSPLVWCGLALASGLAGSLLLFWFRGRAPAPAEVAPAPSAQQDSRVAENERKLAEQLRRSRSSKRVLPRAQAPPDLPALIGALPAERRTELTGALDAHDYRKALQTLAVAGGSHELRALIEGRRDREVKRYLSLARYYFEHGDAERARMKLYVAWFYDPFRPEVSRLATRHRVPLPPTLPRRTR